MEVNSLEQQTLKNDQLSVVVALGSLHDTKRMLDEGADVNNLDSNGNTPLHIAVHKGYLEIVKLLLKYQANINILNEGNDTALDIAVRSETSVNKNRIIMELQDYIIEESFDILEKYVIHQETLLHKTMAELDDNKLEDNGCKETENIADRREYLNSDLVKLNCRSESETSRPETLNSGPESSTFTTNTATNETIDLDSETKDKTSVSEKENCALDEFKNRKIQSNDECENSLKIDIEAIEECIKSCYDLMCDLKEISENDDPLLTYSQANICLQVLNKFSLFNNYIAKINKQNRGKLLGNYLTRYYLEFESDLEVFGTMSKVLSHSVCKKFTLEDINQYICLRSDKTTIIKSLCGYVEFLSTKVNSVVNKTGSRVDTKSDTILPNLLHRTEEDLSGIGIPNKDILKKELANLIREVYVQEEWTTDRVNKILFSFLVNISPSWISNGPSGLNDLREKVISKYQKYKDVPLMMKQELENAAFVFRSILFRYYLAKEVFAIMYSIDADEDVKQLDEKLCQSLHGVEMEFKEDYKILAPECHETSFYHNCFQSSVSSASEDLALKEFIELYMKFLIIIVTTKIEKQYQIQRQFKFFDLGEELENFLNLKQLKSVSPLLYDKEKGELRKELRENFVTQGRYFKEVCALYIENLDSPRVEIQFEEEIRKTISTIRKLQSKYLIPNKEILFLYSQVLELNNESDVEKTKDLAQKTDLTNVNAAQIITEMSKLYKRKKIEIYLCGDTTRRDTVSIISNAIITFSNLCNNYKIQFNNLEEAFLDEKFLNNLVNETVVKQKDEPNFENYFPFKILLELKYTAPYITSWIINEENINKIGKESLFKLSENLLENSSYIYYLNQLLQVPCEAVVDLYEIICSKINEKNLENFGILFEEPSQVTKILNHLQRPIADTTGSEDKNSVKLRKNILTLLNKIAYDLCLQRRFKNALRILDIYYKEMSGAEELELLVAKRTEANVKYRLGLQQMEDDEDFKENFISCLQILESIKSAIEKVNTRTFEQSVSYLLTLNRIAFSHETLENFADELSALELMYQELKLFATDMPTSATVASNVINHEDILALRKSELYQELLMLSFETFGAFRLGLLCSRMALASQNEAEISCSLRERKYYTVCLNINQEAYFVKYVKKNRLQIQSYEYCNAEISKNIGFIYSRFSKLDFELSADVAFQNSVLALKFFNESFQIKKELVDTRKLYYLAKSISLSISQVIKCSYALNYRWLLKQKLWEVKARHQRLFQALSSNQKIIFELLNPNA